jgi:hypothetical protein
MDLDLGDLHLRLFYDGCNEKEKQTVEKYLTEKREDVAAHLKKFYETGSNSILEIAYCLWIAFERDVGNKVRGHVMGRKVWEEE